MLANGNYLFTHIRGAKEVTPERKVVWEYTSPEEAEVHSCQPLPDGSVLVCECGTKRLVEVDREGRIQKEIPLDTKTPNTHMHFRIARKLTNGHYLVAQVGDHLVREYDAEGKTVRTIPTPGDVYTAVRLPNGNTIVCNWGGHGHVGKQPLIFEVTPEKKVVWQFEDHKQFRTISNVCLLDVEGDPAKGELLR